jgi:hypothetical protein
MGEEIIAFWTKYKLLPPQVSASERVTEVVLVARNEVGHIVGIASAGHIKFKQLNDNNFFAYRSVILPQYRVPGLPQKMIVETRDILEGYASKMVINKCIGMLTFVENPQVMETLKDAVWPSSKMVFIGTDKLGRQIRVYYFKGVTI